jgi:hypothetical protein
MAWHKVFLVVFFTPFVLTSKGQTSFGLEAGMSSGYLNTNITNRASTEITNSIGYTINIPFQFKIKQWLYLETTPGITQKNYSIDRTDSLAGAYETFKNTYVQLPLMAKFVYGNRLQVYADAGFYLGYWLAGRVNGLIPNIFSAMETTNSNGQASSSILFSSYDEKYQFNPQTDNRTEFGWVAGVGAQYHVNKKYQLLISCRYYEALTDQQKKYMFNQVPQYNQTLTISAGTLISFK